ncbi:hypothetical protein OIU85_020366 [Salix viminalis]|uniref:Uncharacterized protein n=1 Tax=Salix viminalis TaxID=40686 RepID=A0A9Q0UGJ0_SALVM|nr:hypothetical protein OIU85_020366 [Salix viminalis]
MEGLMGFVRSPAATPIVRRSLFYASKSKKNSWLRAKLNAENDPLLQAATSAASLRFPGNASTRASFCGSICWLPCSSRCADGFEGVLTPVLPCD